jgi:exosortase/archaeosortase family protein
MPSRLPLPAPLTRWGSPQQWRALIRRHSSNRRSLWLLLAALLFGWNTAVLGLAGVAPDTQVLNLLLWFGCLIALEDRLAELWPRPSRASLVAGTLLLTLTLWRGDFSTMGQDRIFYLFLPLLVLGLALLNQPFRSLRLFIVPLVISLLLPITRVLFATHPVIIPLTTVLTWLTLMGLGFSAEMSGAEIALGSSGVEVGGNCTGIDQIIFTLSVALIFLMVFPLRRWLHRWLVLMVAVVGAVLVNVVRITILALLVDLPEKSGMPAFAFFHDSMGGLLFSIVSVAVMGWCHTALIDRELA